ncbi:MULTISPECIES: tyrosine recombinase XerC [Clostridium]|uniref:Site-Specific Recombinase, Xerd n=1 Tax=Clostridium acetobutylicum (strain ATCC 824 / DSM 792 / JCM 1419 / IAM 19013 / LMG 5710 / NBRC 13948 / NRRL B-527 / VKM B-1787 / 2291 / W) TaxID=272562 RepID=Q97TM0_CLOAB|nr:MULTISPECIES: tyrosine recombinase XerC [Clostridium]AAK76826.1 Site-Specific Recombinase, Xerd [Clostridium acetobutylicum ATCC 824]AEI34822.1 site-specific tyrosine recombinase XerC [Clostridium acetobutylicum DSM 1731]AWV82449.1 tyrosine recombinase XerC [Clostridium acetobutylicum]MBC2395786.1 tyrosine recombinase XerC [Clostridium acetobutylicum]MBC2585032.1 tyrosine recombinase XerC [Clostridium acetobutylicum]
MPMTLTGFLIYMTNIKGKSKRTRNEYKNDLILMLKYIKVIKYDINTNGIENVDISDIDNDFIKAISLEDLYIFLEYCEDERRNGAYSRARKVAAIRSFFNYLTTKKKILDYNPAQELEKPKLPKRNPVYLTIGQANTFLSGIKMNKHYYRNTCIVTLFLNCGMRVSELCNININSIKNDMISIIGKGDKERTVYLNDMCIDAINKYIEKERSLQKNIKCQQALFISQKGTRISVRTIENLVKKINEDSKLNINKLTPHKLRHTFATTMYQAGTDIISLQQLLGHSNVSTTQIYTHVTDDRLREATNKNPFNIQFNKKKSIKEQ